MKIAFVTQPWDIVVPEIGGSTSIPILTYQLARQLAAKRSAAHEVWLFGRGDGHHASQETDRHGLHYHRLNLQAEDWLMKPLKAWDKLRPTSQLFASPLYYRLYIERVAAKLAEIKPDIIHVHNFSQYLPILRRTNPHSRLVLHMHCEWLSQLPAATIARRLAAADAVLGCSGYISQKIAQRFPQTACHVLWNGVDADRFSAHEPASPPRLLFAGRVSPEKGVHDLLEAFGLVVAQRPEVELDIVGAIGATARQFIVGVSDDLHVLALGRFYDRGDYFSQLQAILPPEAWAKVHFYGFVPHAEMPRFYQAASLLVNPSLSEAFGMSLIEGMAAGLPVVATAVGGMVDLVQEGVNGLRVPPANPTELATALLGLLGDPALCQTMGQNGRHTVQARFTWVALATELERIYQSL